jgi:4-hydroxybenzoate polyprenyltransferase
METPLRALQALIRTMRPRQWTKNILFVFPAIIFDAKLLQLDLLLRVIAACILLILMSGTVYIINDLLDIESDKQHPKKRFRPIPSGELPLNFARASAILIPVVTLILAFLFDVYLAFILITYLILQIAYSVRLKHIALLDVLSVAFGFVLRTIAGGVVINVVISPWLYAFTGLLALFLVIAKRRQELVKLGEEAKKTRPIFQQYNLPLLDDMLRMVTTSTLMTYILYTIEVQTMTINGVNLGLLTVPFVLYGLFRYLYLIHVDEVSDAPDEVLLRDRPMQATVLLAGIAFVIILYIV